MSYGCVVKLKPNRRLRPETAHAVVAAQLRGEARARDEEPSVVVDAIAHEIEGLGLVPDQEELGRRYAVSTALPEGFAERVAAG